MHHPASVDVSRRSMCDIRCLITMFTFSWPKKHNMHHRTSTDSIRQSMCDNRCLYSLGQKITTCIIAHRPIRRSMCDICFCISWSEKSQHASSHIDRFDSPVDVRYPLLYHFARKSQHASSHIDRFDSPSMWRPKKIARFRSH